MDMTSLTQNRKMAHAKFTVILVKAGDGAATTVTLPLTVGAANFNVIAILSLCHLLNLNIGQTKVNGKLRCHRYSFTH